MKAHPKTLRSFFITLLMLALIINWFDAAASNRAGTMHYKIDSSRSRFIARAFVGGLLSAFGHDHTIAIRDFTGEAQLTPVTFEPASLQLVIRADSLAVTDKVSDDDRRKIETTMRDEVLETSKYPEIIFKSRSVSATKTGEGQYQVKITGDLTLHGVTRSQVIHAQVALTAGGLRARGQFSVRHSDYNIKRVSVAGGTIKVKDEMKLSFDIVANQV